MIFFIEVFDCVQLYQIKFRDIEIDKKIYR